MNPAPPKQPADAPETPPGDGLLDHEYDGIREYDNPMPRWWLWLFYATIAFSALYALNLPGIGVGKGRIANYERDMARAREREARLAQTAAPMTEERLLAMIRDPAQLAIGRTTFTNQCGPCHMPDGGGNIGPNLTDAYWLHGGKPLDLYRTVTAGVLEKGMPAWETVLPPKQLPAVVAYVLTLRGTHPANPKPPQGTKLEATEEPNGAR